MGKIYQTDWSAGYCPGDDYINGRQNALLRMDNLNLDNNGSVTLALAPNRYNQSQGSLGQSIISVFVKFLNGKPLRFVQLADYSVLLDPNNLEDFNIPVLPSAIGPRTAGFGSGYGRIFVCNGNGNVMVDDTGKVENWNVPAPTAAPIISLSGLVDGVNSSWYAGDISNFNNFTLEYGTNLTTDDGTITFVTSNSDGAGSDGAIIDYIPTDSMNLSYFPASSESGADDDQFAMAIRFEDYTQIDFVSVMAFTDPDNWYHFNWDQGYFANSWYNNSDDTNWSCCVCYRSDFVGEGSPDWTNITFVKIQVKSYSEQTYTITIPFEFYNGNNTGANTAAGLDGSQPIVYYQQNLIHLDGTAGASLFGPPSNPIYGKWSSVGIIPQNPTDSRVYEVDIYKNGGILSDNFYYAISSGVPVTEVYDTEDDLSRQASGDVATGALWLTTIPTDIVMMEGPVNGRMILMSPSSLYFSDLQNPTVIDDRMTIEPSASSDETCLFITKISNTVLLLATTQDFYEISGTFADNGDGTFDIYNRPSGIKQPAVSPAFCFINNALVYIGATTIRQLSFSVTQAVTQELNNLFRYPSSFGVLAFESGSFDTDPTGTRWFLAFSKQRLYCRVTHTDSTLSVLIYDIDKNNWSRRLDQPNCFYADENGNLFAGYNDGYARYYSQTYLYDLTIPQPINFMSTCLAPPDDGLTRKDLFTLKLMVATGGSNIAVTLNDESNRVAKLGNYSTPNDNITSVFIPVHGTDVDLGQRFSLNITDYNNTGVNFFRLNNWELTYDSRPERELFLYIPPNNFGSPSKKRIRTLPLVIDTMGGNVIYQPIVDLQPVGPTTIFNTPNKQTVYYLFETDVFGVDYGGTLTAETIPFEFYNFLNPVSVEELPPPKLYDQIGPYALDKRGKIYGFRTRIVSQTTSINYNIIADDVSIYQGSFPTVPGIDTTYEVLRLPPGLLANIIRIEFTSPDNTKAFMRWYVQLRVTTSGMGSDEQWITIAGEVNASQ